MPLVRNVTLVIAIALAVSSAGCGLVFGVRREGEAAPGAALAAFKRDLGLAGRGETRVAAEATSASGGRLRLTPAERDAMVAEREQAQRLLAKLPEDATVDDLPSGTDRVAMLARALGLLRLRRPADAVELLQPILAAEPRHFPALEYLAECRMRQERYAEAEAIWRDLVQAIPEESTFRMRLADSVYGQKDPAKKEAALAMLEGWVDGPFGASAASRLANLYLDRYEAAESVRVLRKASASLPGDRKLQVMLAQALRFEGEHAAAIEVLEPIADRAGDYQAHAIYELVWALRGLGRYDDAQERLETLLRGNFTAYVARRRAVLTQLQKDLQEEGRLGERVSFSPYELRHRLRESEDAKDRLHAIEVLFANAEQVQGVANDFGHVLRTDPDAGVRRRAMQVLIRMDPEDPSPLRAMLADGAARNRMVASGLLTRFDPEASKHIYGALRREQDAAAFAHMHRTLEEASGERLFLPSGAAATETGRRKICDQWSQRLGLAAGGNGAGK